MNCCCCCCWRCFCCRLVVDDEQICEHLGSFYIRLRFYSVHRGCSTHRIWYIHTNSIPWRRCIVCSMYKRRRGQGQCTEREIMVQKSCRFVYYTRLCMYPRERQHYTNHPITATNISDLTKTTTITKNKPENIKRTNSRSLAHSLSLWQCVFGSLFFYSFFYEYPFSIHIR